MDLRLGDCREVMAEMDPESVDAIVCDPPYSLQFMGRAWDRHDDFEDDAAFGYYLSGLIDGEGCFRVQGHPRGTYACTFSVKLRRDDKAILLKAQRWLGAGTICDVEGSGNAHPLTSWVVQDKAGCQRLEELL